MSKKIKTLVSIPKIKWEEVLRRSEKYHTWLLTSLEKLEKYLNSLPYVGTGNVVEEGDGVHYDNLIFTLKRMKEEEQIRLVIKDADIGLKLYAVLNRISVLRKNKRISFPHTAKKALKWLRTELHDELRYLHGPDVKAKVMSLSSKKDVSPQDKALNTLEKVAKENGHTDLARDIRECKDLTHSNHEEMKKLMDQFHSSCIEDEDREDSKPINGCYNTYFYVFDAEEIISYYEAFLQDTFSEENVRVCENKKKRGEEMRRIFKYIKLYASLIPLVILRRINVFSETPCPLPYNPHHLDSYGVCEAAFDEIRRIEEVLATQKNLSDPRKAELIKKLKVSSENMIAFLCWFKDRLAKVVRILHYDG